jgi:pimeloyl-ACP methyl ester carboxylesterase
MAVRTKTGKTRRGRRRPPAKRVASPRRDASAAPAGAARSAYNLAADEVERLLRSREHGAVLEEYFGNVQYRELRDLAQEAAAARVRGGARVLILPGIMGSTLGRHRTLLDDVIWLDPIDIARGKLLDLALPGGNIAALGVILFAYLKLKLRLKIAGYDADFHPFDWRQSIDDLGGQLLDRIKDDPANQVYLVAHSMGGLVARAALALPDNKKIVRLIMLGTPNYGSFSPVQALTATHPLVRKVVAALDLKHSAEDLAERVFKTLPGLYQMLPSPERFNRVDLYTAAVWPGSTPRPDPTILGGVRAVQDGLAKADARFFLIAGVNQETITGLHIEDGDFVYETSNDGDGTVPLAFAQLPGTTTYYVEEQHGSLPNNRVVEQAVIDILAGGATERLPTTVERSRAGGRNVSRAALVAEPVFEGRRGSEVSRAELRHVLDEFVSPEARDGMAPAVRVVAADRSDDAHAADEAPRDQVVVARRRQRLLEIRLAHGSITDLRTRAYVLGLFKEVDPSGAAAAIDHQLDGAVKEFTTRRMFSGQVGEVFAMPAGRYRLGAETVLFTGLGTFDAFNSEVLQFVAENVVRTFVRTHVEDFATVLLGSGSGTSAAKSVYNHLVGFFRGLGDADRDQDLRRITFCEIDPERFSEMREEIYRLARTSLFDDFQVTLSEVELPPPAAPPPAARARLDADAALAYLIVRQEPSPDHAVVYRSSVLTAGSNATVLTGSREIERTKLTGLLKRIEGSGFSAATLPSFGRELAALVLDPDVSKGLKEMRDYHLVVVHDAPTSQIPWETLAIGDWFPAAEQGMSRRYAADNLSVAKWLEERRYGEQLDILLVVNPRLDLAGAEEEAKRIEKIFPSSSRIRLHRLHGTEATRAALLSAFRSGKYDVIHYAGHAYFDEASPALSGLLCNDARLTGADLAGLSNLPALVFFNACEAGRIRGNSNRREVHKRIATNVGLAEAFLRGGVSSYIGTYWPVGDSPAAAFAAAFYNTLVAGKSVGAAVNAGRGAVRALSTPSVDWADYVHYGSHDFIIKGLGTNAT